MRGDATANLMIRLSPELKEAVKRLADAEHRPVSQFVVKLLRDTVAAAQLAARPAPKKKAAAR